MKLKELRKEKNLSQKEISKVLNVAQNTYSRYETEEREPPLEIIIKLANFYKCDIDYLIERDWKK